MTVNPPSAEGHQNILFAAGDDDPKRRRSKRAKQLDEFNRRGRNSHKRPRDLRNSSPRRPGNGENEKRVPLRRRILTGFALVLLGGLAIFWYLDLGGFTSVKTSEGKQVLQEKKIELAQITEGVQQVQVWLKDDFTPTDTEGEKLKPTKKVQFQYANAEAAEVAKLVQDAKPENGYNSLVPQQSFLSSMFTLMLPMLLIIGLFMWLLPKMQSGMTAFGKVKRDGMDSDLPDVTFADVAGVDEAVEELREIKEFIDTPDKFHKMGAKIPKGVLLYGPPGTGKTLLAKAVAGEAGVPFFHISASEFVEMFVGVGASRVRDLFNKAKKTAPAIIFVDEIDAVGRNRGSGIGGGNDEREQTLNQLLVEMDGFDEHTNVIVIAATNRPDVLDSALLRPGRFDRQIAVDAPDLPGRRQILDVHAKGKPLADDVELEAIARRTPGFSGADLANLLNEAALLAARREHEVITEDDVDEAIDRVLAGPQRRTRVMNAEEKRMTAYHEGGHAVAAAALNYTDPVTKVTILPRGRALGYTMVMPTEDKYSTSRNELLDQLVYAMGGRIAEEIVFHDPSTGASNDIQKATNIARKMVTEYGMSARVGAVRLVADDSDPMTRMGGGNSREYSEEMARIVDDEVQKLLDTANQEAWQVLNENRHVLDKLAARLLEKETILENELKEIFKEIRKAPKRVQWLSSPDRPVSDIPPVPLPQELVDTKHSAAEGIEIGPGATDVPPVTEQES
ncbi:ATP-dependent zinc metalloprotease FtsH [Arcanobacterium bovis]|uniref:ATP-dependent zinc metalloprotease FtsH n=1 Tax=Arcanobacterium bovis TaxID=2529275 RepID=A0A4Q9UZM9_9ACTO|nr:ATP-dependent zinc metalloprotease FtsH [Arcanobacterium bovis]TBW21485.1 ATP-dependent zinc metalloprotease FtsH [Arcanobacterium bovis]